METVFFFVYYTWDKSWAGEWCIYMLFDDFTLFFFFKKKVWLVIKRIYKVNKLKYEHILEIVYDNNRKREKSLIYR